MPARRSNNQEQQGNAVAEGLQENAVVEGLKMRTDAVKLVGSRRDSMLAQGVRGSVIRRGILEWKVLVGTVPGDILMDILQQTGFMASVMGQQHALVSSHATSQLGRTNARSLKQLVRNILEGDELDSKEAYEKQLEGLVRAMINDTVNLWDEVFDKAQKRLKQNVGSPLAAPLSDLHTALREKLWLQAYQERLGRRGPDDGQPDETWLSPVEVKLLDREYQRAALNCIESRKSSHQRNESEYNSLLGAIRGNSDEAPDRVVCLAAAARFDKTVYVLQDSPSTSSRKRGQPEGTSSVGPSKKQKQNDASEKKLCTTYEHLIKSRDVDKIKEYCRKGTCKFRNRCYGVEKHGRHVEDLQKLLATIEPKN
jgi:hypothetical protein